MEAPFRASCTSSRSSIRAIRCSRRFERFLRGLAGSSYWTATTAEYGVGAIDVAPSLVLPNPPPTVVDDAQIGPRLSSALGGHGRSNSAYFVFFPHETTVTEGPLTSCRDFDGYHGEWPGPESAGLSDGALDELPDAVPAEQGDADSGGPADAEGLPDAIDPAPPSAPATFGFLYAVIARCPGPLAAIDAVTVAASHESVEMATDPLPLTFPAFRGPDVDHLVWANVSFGEVADMCEFAEAPTSTDQRFVDGFMVQRTWSNAAAEANQGAMGHKTAEELRVTLTRLLLFSITVEALTGLALFIAPSWVARLLLGTALSPSGTAVARVCGCGLLSLGVAWCGGLRSDDATAPAFRGMLFYNAAIAVYLGYLCARGTTEGPLLLVVVVLHAAVSLLLVGVAGRMIRRGKIAGFPFEHFKLARTH